MRLKQMSLGVIVCVGLIACFADVAVAELGPELIKNGDFESKGDPYPGWKLDTVTQNPIINVGGTHGNVLEAQREGEWTVCPVTEKRIAPWVGARYGGSQTVTVTLGDTYKLEFDRYAVAAPSKFTGITIHGVNLVSADPTIWWRRGKDVYMHPPWGEWVHHTIYMQAIGATITINSWGVHLSTVRIDNVSLKKVLAAWDIPQKKGIQIRD